MTLARASEQDVLFYVLNSDDPETREKFVCKLLHTIYQKQRLCDVRLANESDAKRFDRQLWAWKPEAFIPHGVAQQTPAPIQLYWSPPTKTGASQSSTANPTHDVLINLHPEFPSFFNQYQRTIEVLDQSAYLLKMGRERFRAYRQQNLEPTVHKIGF